MQSVLKELWYGNIDACASGRNMSKRTRKLMKTMAEHYDTLRNMLGNKERALFEKYDAAYTDLMESNEQEVFIYAFQLGARIAIEVMSLNIGGDEGL